MREATGESKFVSKPVFRRHLERGRAFVDWRAGDGITDAGEALATVPGAPLSVLLVELPSAVEQVFICGERPGGAGSGYADWIMEPRVFQEWEDRGIHRDPEHPVIRLAHRKTGRRVTLYSIGPWFGTDVSPRAARSAFELLGELLREKFAGEGVTVLPTPALTGVDLWDRRRSGREYPVLPDELLELVRSTSGQGRVQICPPAGLETVPGFYYLDGRWAYAAFTYRLPVWAGEPPRVEEIPEHDPYRPGLYEIRFRVPEDWRHIGIFPVKARERDPITGELKWEYPAEPGSEWETWAHHPELLLAERFGWRYEIRRRLLFEAAGQRGAPTEPLRAWRDALVELRGRVERMGERAELPPETAGLLSGALRAILLFTVGYFHRSRRSVFRVVHKDELRKVPPQFERTIEGYGELRTYREVEPLSGKLKRHAHPEWSSTIWAKTRARMLHSDKFHGAGVETGALTLPRGDVLAIRTDALYLARDPGWPETGKIGELRLKGRLPGPIPVPTKNPELNDLRDRAEKAREG